jgi:hypothetical protein
MGSDFGVFKASAKADTKKSGHAAGVLSGPLLHGPGGGRSRLKHSGESCSAPLPFHQ